MAPIAVDAGAEGALDVVEMVHEAPAFEVFMERLRAAAAWLAEAAAASGPD